MPVDRVPVVHKFGIISHSQRLALEDRLAKKSLATEPPRTFSRTSRQPYEVTEDFIARFNDSNEEDRKELEGVALKMITRAKRRAGILSGGKGNHVDLGRSWTELGLLAQCSSRDIQEESLELLVTSLGHAPPTIDQLPSLFYLAKSALHWLRKCGMNKSCLRTAELKLIRMGQLTFVRLYYHNMTQDLKRFPEEKQSLLQYLAGFPEEHEDSYKSFPGALLAVRYMKEVGRLICAGCDTPVQHQAASTEAVADAADQEPAAQSPPAADRLPAVEAVEKVRVGLPLVPEEEEEDVYEGSGEIGFNDTVALTHPHTPGAASSIHDLSPTLWHALDVWRSVMHKGTGLRQALEGLSMCGTALTTELWLDVCCAFQVLTEASKHDLTVLRTFQALAAGILTKPAGLSDAHARHLHLCDQCLSTITGHQGPDVKDFPDLEFDLEREKTQSASDYLSLAKTPSFVRGLRDFAHLGLGDEDQVTPSEETESIASRNTEGDTSSEASFADVSSVESGRHGSPAQTKRTSASTTSKTYRKTREIAARKGESSSESEDGSPRGPVKQFKPVGISKKEEETEAPRRHRSGTGVRFDVKEPEVAVVDTEGGPLGFRMERALTKDSLFSGHTLGSSVTIPLAEEDLSDDKSSVKTATSEASSVAGLPGWRWELAYLYTDSMTTVCLNGQTSTIQKTALLGSEANRKVTVYGKKNVMSREGLGLLDLLKVKFPLEGDKVSSVKDWSWRVRFAAVQGLVRVCRHCSGDSTKDGLRGMAWNQLMRHHSLERDVRVLEAWKLAKIESELDNKLPVVDVVNSSFPSWAAARLTAVLLPPLPPVVPLSSLSRPRSRAVPLYKPASTVKKGPTRPSLRQEILLATAAHEPQPNYRSRMNHELMLVIEDQWRKQLHEEQEQEEAERREKEAAKERRSGEGVVVDGQRVAGGREVRGRRSRDGIIEDGLGAEGDRGGRGEWGRRSSGGVAVDGQKTIGGRGGKGRRSREEIIVDG